MLDMCGDFQGTWYCSVDCPNHFKQKAEHAKSLCSLGSAPEIGKWQQVETARTHLEQYEHEDEVFLCHVITMDDTWIRSYTPELKRQSSEWRYTESHLFRAVLLTKCEKQ